MNIVHLLGNQYLPRCPDEEGSGGVTRVALELARAQVSLGHQVSVVVVDREPWGTEWQGVQLRGVPMLHRAVVRLGPRQFDFRRHLPYLLFTLRQPVDVVHGHAYSYLRFLRAPARLVHFHGDPFYRGSKNESFDLKPADFLNIARFSHAQIAVSEFVAHELRRGFGAAGKVHVVYNAVNTEHFNPHAWHEAGAHLRHTHGIRRDAVVFLFAGAIVPVKGVLHLAHAFGQLAAETPDTHLLLAGGTRLWGSTLADTSDHDHYERQVAQELEPLRAAGRAHFTGKVSSNQMPALYAACDVLVVPSTWREAFGLVALEALACGRPVIASRTGGLVELVNERTGILVEPGDHQSIATALRTLRDNPTLRAQLGAAARQQALRFSWETAVRTLDPIYQQILAQKRR
ncbi:MAG: glycosyltransferase family 4 protein [Chloroflexaceae bacterium]|nr:glycosyltransferase family 4 protein [Chloroflexaceae bacterium]